MGKSDFPYKVDTDPKFDKAPHYMNKNRARLTGGLACGLALDWVPPGADPGTRSLVQVSYWGGDGRGPPQVGMRGRETELGASLSRQLGLQPLGTERQRGTQVSQRKGGGAGD